MKWVFVLLGALMVAGGVGCIAIGYPVVEVEQGWTLTIVGAVVATGGILVLAASAILAKLEAIAVGLSAVRGAAPLAATDARPQVETLASFEGVDPRRDRDVLGAPLKESPLAALVESPALESQPPANGQPSPPPAAGRLPSLNFKPFAPRAAPPAMSASPKPPAFLSPRKLERANLSVDMAGVEAALFGEAATGETPVAHEAPTDALVAPTAAPEPEASIGPEAAAASEASAVEPAHGQPDDVNATATQSLIASAELLSAEALLQRRSESAEAAGESQEPQIVVQPSDALHHGDHSGAMLGSSEHKVEEAHAIEAVEPAPPELIEPSEEFAALGELAQEPTRGEVGIETQAADHPAPRTFKKFPTRTSAVPRGPWPPAPSFDEPPATREPLPSPVKHEEAFDSEPMLASEGEEALVLDFSKNSDEDWFERAMAGLDESFENDLAEARGAKASRAPASPRRPEAAPEEERTAQRFSSAAEPAVSDLSPQPTASLSAAKPKEPRMPEPSPRDDLRVEIGRYETEGTLYVMYADGSIDARSGDDVYRFASLAALKAHIETVS